MTSSRCFNEVLYPPKKLTFNIAIDGTIGWMIHDLRLCMVLLNSECITVPEIILVHVFVRERRQRVEDIKRNIKDAILVCIIAPCR